jgi:DNA repair exonuclease SbcCD ATPase subunit
LAENYRLGLKKIIGVDPNGIGWESKIVKSDDSNKDITDLQTQITNLNKLKEETEKQLKQKQDQILNHRCNTPNNAELNQTKEELEQANKEITSLKEQLGNKPNSPNDKEEEKQENNNLTSEQLKEKLKGKQEEIKSLLTQLNQQKKQVNHHGSYSWGTLFIVGVVCLLSGSLIMFIIKKKKKNTAEILN